MSLTASTGLMRALGAVLMVTASLALGACGDDEDSGSSSAGAGTKAGLGTERFEALDAVYKAAIPLDELDDDAPVADFEKVLKDYEAECTTLDAEDTLLAAYRRFCPLLAELREQLVAAGECENEEEVQACLDGVSGFRAVVRKFLSEGERYDSTINSAKLAAACKGALVNPPLSYEVMRGYGRAFAYLQRALTTGSEADVNKADAIMKRAETQAERLPDAKEALADFRSGCA